MATQRVDQITGWGETLAYKAPVRVVSDVNITLEGLQTIDGVTVAANDRVGVLAQTDARENGIYIVSTGLWSRSRDFDSNRDITKGTRVAVNEGSVYAGSEWRISSANPISLGEDGITFVRADLVAQASDQVSYAEEWSQNPEDVPVSVAAGGDGATDFSALHWSEKTKEWGEEWSQKAEDSLVSIPAGGNGSTEYSAYHWSKKSEGFRDQAAGYAALALNNHVVDTFVGDGTTDPVTLTADPGSINNVEVKIEGFGPQPKSAFTLSGRSLTPTEVWPNGAGIEVSYGTSIEVGTPADGSITAAKLAANAVTRDKVADDAIGADEIDATEASAIKTKLGIAAASTLVPGFFSGFKLANSGSHGIVFNPGAVWSDDVDPILIVLDTATTKLINAPFVAGTGNGGLDTGTVADGTYHAWAVANDDGSTVDVIFSLSTSAPTMPSGYTKKGYLWPVVRGSSANWVFAHSGDYFSITDPFAASNTALSATAALITMPAVPTGFSVLADFDATIFDTSSNLQAWFSSPLATDLSASAGVRSSLTTDSNPGRWVSGSFTRLTDTSARIRAVGSVAIAQCVLIATGWRFLR